MTFEQSLAIAVLIATMGGLGFLCWNRPDVYKIVGTTVLIICGLIAGIMFVYEQGYRDGIYAQWEPAMRAASDAEQQRYLAVEAATTVLTRQGVDTTGLRKANPMRTENVVKAVSTAPIDSWVWECLLILLAEQFVLLILAGLLGEASQTKASHQADKERPNGDQQ